MTVSASNMSSGSWGEYFGNASIVKQLADVIARCVAGASAACCSSGWQEGTVEW